MNLYWIALTVCVLFDFVMIVFIFMLLRALSEINSELDNVLSKMDAGD